MGELKRQDRFCTAIFIEPAWVHAVAAAPGGQIGQHCAAIIGPEEPAVSGNRMIDPALVIGDRVSHRAGFDRGLRLKRLLVERH